MEEKLSGGRSSRNGGGNVLNLKVVQFNCLSFHLPRSSTQTHIFAKDNNLLYYIYVPYATYVYAL